MTRIYIGSARLSYVQNKKFDNNNSNNKNNAFIASLRQIKPFWGRKSLKLALKIQEINIGNKQLK